MQLLMLMNILLPTMIIIFSLESPKKNLNKFATQICIYKNDHTEGYKKRGFIRFNYIDIVIDSKFLIENVDGLYGLFGCGVRVASRTYEVDYDSDLYSVDIDHFEDYEANRKYTKAQFMIRGGAGYEYQMEKMAFFAEGIVSASIHDLVPEVKFPYFWSVGLTLGTKFYLN